MVTDDTELSVRDAQKERCNAKCKSSQRRRYNLEEEREKGKVGLRRAKPGGGGQVRVAGISIHLRIGAGSDSAL